MCRDQDYSGEVDRWRIPEVTEREREEGKRPLVNVEGDDLEEVCDV